MERRDFLASLPVILPITATCPVEPAPERPVDQRLIMQLWSLQDVCEEAILQTCFGCQRTVKDRGCCMECEDLDALHWSIRNFRTIFESAVVGFPELRERWKQERGA